jgi:ubiquinone/menaquinone biosynthesis C-methylase UbiE
MSSEHAMQLLRLSEGLTVPRLLQLAAELGIADHLADKPCTTRELATATSTDATALHRLLRALAAAEVFTEVEPGRFALTGVGEHLCSDHHQSLRSWILFQGLFNGVYAEAMHSIRTGEATVPAVFGEPLFEYLGHHPDAAAVFQDAMGQHSRLMGPRLVEAYDFTGVQRVVDVGGGDGTFLSTILHAHPHMSGVVYDAPYVAESARKQLAAAGLGDRCTFVSGDFLEAVHPGGEVYMLKGVVHNWSDDEAVVLLRNCRRAMGDDGRLLLIEWAVPPGDVPHPSKLLDLSMLFVYGGKERTEQEFADLLSAADLRIARVIGTASTLNVIEAVAT